LPETKKAKGPLLSFEGQARLGFDRLPLNRDLVPSLLKPIGYFIQDLTRRRVDLLPDDSGPGSNVRRIEMLRQDRLL